MSAHYLIRFDDICPTMNWNMWSRIESLLLELQICPILAVIPDNRDRNLMIASPRVDFWNEVRKWQARGWTIALHGFQHVYSSCEGGILRFPDKSEFAGIPAVQQEEKLAQALSIFQREGITPQLWSAPSHSFDELTLAALDRIGIRMVSDGFAILPHIDARGMFWVPQQLWKFRWRPFGVWTVCYHHNFWSEERFVGFCRDVRRYRGKIIGLRTVKVRYESRRPHFLDSIYSKAHCTVLITRRLIGLAS